MDGVAQLVESAGAGHKVDNVAPFLLCLCVVPATKCIPGPWPCPLIWSAPNMGTVYCFKSFGLMARGTTICVVSACFRTHFLQATIVDNTQKLAFACLSDVMAKH